MRGEIVHRFVQERRSVTAVEFAMIGPLLLLFVCAIIFIGVAQFWQQTLDDSVRKATRQLELGAITTSAGFVSGICGEFGAAAPNCAGRLQYAVQEQPYFAAMSNVTLQANGSLSAGSQFPAAVIASSAGAPQYFLAQVAYPLPFTMPLVPAGFVTENGTATLYSAAATAAQP